jgi:hypothetical protein
MEMYRVYSLLKGNTRQDMLEKMWKVIEVDHYSMSLKSLATFLTLCSHSKFSCLINFWMKVKKLFKLLSHMTAYI